MRRPWLPAIAAMMFVATVVLADPTGKYADWAAGPASHLMTPAEKAAWQAVTTEAQAEAFVALFWAKRDPNSTTPVNELREEFDRRVALADEHFTTKRTRGSMTDRGRALIVLGPPAQVGSKGPASRASSNPSDPRVWNGGVSGPRGESAKLTWTYANDKKPKFIKRKEFEILFVDDQGDGQYAFAKTARLDPEAILLEAVNAQVFAPDLTTPPAPAVPVSTVTAVDDTRVKNIKALTDQFRAEGKSSEGPARLTWGQFVTPAGDTFVPVQLFLPASSGSAGPRQVTFFGLVENSAGQVVTAYEDQVTLATSGRDAYVDKSLLLPPGTYKATFGLSDQGKILALTSADMNVAQLDPKETAISDLILSNNAFPLPQAQKLTDPFAFGGLKVVPKGDAVFLTSDDIWFFYELRNPGVTDTGAPKVQAKILIEGKADDGTPVKMNFPIQEFETIPLKGVDNHYALAMTFPLKDFKPGSYDVRIKVIDTVLKKSYDSAKKFEIRR